MPVRRDRPNGKWLQERNRRRLLFEATGQGREWLEQNDGEWLERYLYNQARMRRTRSYPVGYY